MQITKVSVRPLNRPNKVKATASVTFDDTFIIHDVRIIEGDKGLFIAMPSRKLPNGTFRDVAHPLNQEMRDAIQTAVLEEFDRAAGESKADTKEEPE